MSEEIIWQREVPPNFRETKACIDCKYYTQHICFNDRCEKYSIEMPKEIASHVCDSYERSKEL